MDIDVINALLDEAKPVERAFAVCLRKDLVAEFEALDRERENLPKHGGGNSLAGPGSAAREIAEQLEALREQMKASTITVKVRALPRKAFRNLVAAHPPRKDEEGNVRPNDRIGFNADTFFEPLVRASIVEPALTPERWTRLLDETLSDGQYQELASLCWLVNTDDVDIPFSEAASEILKGSTPA